MRTLIKLLAVLLICLAGIGIWRGWFNFSVNHDRMTNDVNKVERKAEQEIHHLEKEVKSKASIQ